VICLHQQLGFEDKLLSDCHRSKLEEQQWEDELLQGSCLQGDSAGRLILLLYTRLRYVAEVDIAVLML